MHSIFRPGLFSGHVAIVTGGGSGIGLAIARTLCELGASVAIAGRDAGKLERAKAGLAERGWTVHAGVCDIREVEQVASFVAAARAALGEISVLVNNAGGQFPSPAELLTPRGWDAVIRNNLNGTFYTTSAALPAMINQRFGRIINISSVVGQMGAFGQANYSASKGGIIAFTKTLALEMAKFNITANAIAPGFTSTEMVEAIPEEIASQIKAKIPLGRFASPEEVAKAAGFLAAEADYITGQELNVNGGYHM